MTKISVPSKIAAEVVAETAQRNGAADIALTPLPALLFEGAKHTRDELLDLTYGRQRRQIEEHTA
jgi:hypothetical protein